MSQTKAQLISDLVQALNFTGTATAPANGLFLSAANTLKLATASTERLKIDGTEVVVNDTGASVDFRVEGDTEANLLFVDASADKVGIGTSSPGNKLHVEGAAASGGFITKLFNTVGSSDVAGHVLFLDANRSDTTNTKLIDSKDNKFTVFSNGAANFAGNVGIGTTSPDTLLHLAGADTAVIRLENTDTSLNTDQLVGGFEFEKQDPSGAGVGVVGGLRMYSGVNGITTYLTLSTSNSTTNNEEHVRITSDGRLGINTTNPGAKLEAASADSTYALKLTCSENVSGSYNGLSIAGADENSGSYPLVVVSNSTTHETGGHPILCCNQRKVGIGTLTPTAYLDVESNAASGYVAEFRQINTSNSAQILIDSPTDADSRPALIDLARAGTVKWSIGQGYNATGGHLYFATSSLSSGVTDAKVVIETGGFVGIGTTNPNENLMVVDTHANQPKIRIETSDGGNKRLDLFVDSNSVATISAQQSAQNINIKSRNQTIFTQGSTAAEVESMRIDSDGRLLVGTTASLGVLGLAAQLQIAGDTAGESSLALRRFGDSAQGAFLTFSKSRNAADNSRTIAHVGDELGRIAFCMDDGNDLTHAGAEIRANVDGAPGQDDTPGRLVFLTTQDGANSLTERYRITNQGNLGWRNQAIFQRKHYFFVGQSGGTILDTKISEDFGNGDMARVQYSYMWNDGDGGAWGTAIVWKHHDGNVEIRKLGEEIASPAEDLTFVVSGNDLFIRFDLVANSGMNGYAYLSVECGGCNPFPF